MGTGPARALPAVQASADSAFAFTVDSTAPPSFSTASRAAFEAPATLKLSLVFSSPLASRRTPSLPPRASRSEEHTSELQSLMRISYAVFCLKKNIKNDTHITQTTRRYY